MNRCCSAAGVNVMDWSAGRHILLLGESAGGHMDSAQCARVPGLFSVSHLLPSQFLPSSLTFSSLSTPELHPQHSYHPLSCPSEPLSAILFGWSLTCNVLWSASGGAQLSEKVKMFIIRSTRPLRGKWGGKEKMKVTWKVIQYFPDTVITHCKQLGLIVQRDITHFISHFVLYNTEV